MNDRLIILVTGLPGSGKTSLGTQLARTLGLPLLSRDAIKEAIGDAAESDDELSAKLLGAASSKVLWRLLADCHRGAIVDTWINTVRGDGRQVKSELRKANIPLVYEIFCRVSGDVAAERYARRRRNSVHRADEKVLAEIRSLAKQLNPLGLGPAYEVNTSSPVDLEPLLKWLKDSGELKSRAFGILGA